MALNLLTQLQYAEPAAADGILLTSPGSAWGSSAFVEILASAPSALVLSGIVVRPTVAANIWNIDVEIDIATGAASSEVVISTLRFTYQDVFAVDTNSGPMSFRLPIGIDNIANNARVSARIRISTTSTFTCRIAIQFFRKPITPNTYLTTANPIKVLPPAANSVAMIAGTAWVNGAYVQLRTNSGAALILLGLTTNSAAGTYEVDIATGTAASEVVITTVRIEGNASNSDPAFYPLPNPLDLIGVNIRVAARVRGSVGSATFRIALMVLEKPI